MLASPRISAISLTDRLTKPANFRRADFETCIESIFWMCVNNWVASTVRNFAIVVAGAGAGVVVVDVVDGLDGAQGDEVGARQGLSHAEVAEHLPGRDG